MRKHLRLFLLLLLVAGLAPDGSTRALEAEPENVTWQDQPNLVQNPGFEGNYFAWGGINEVQVAHGWTPWWRQRQESDPDATYFKPEFKQASVYIFPQRVRNGTAAQQWFTFHATHQAGMYQQVFNVTPGTRYRFSAWAQVWSSTEDDPAKSVNPAYPNLRVGIDPTGQWNPWAGSVVWSEAQAFYDTWGQLAVEAVAQNNVITVFLHSAPNWPVKHNDTYWDDAALVAVSGSSNPPPPPTATAVPPTATSPPGAPTNTPLPPANSPTPAPPTATCASPPEDWAIYVVQRGDTLYGLARERGTTLERVVSVNCLASTSLLVNQELYLPPAAGTPAGTATPVEPTATPTEAATETATAAPTGTAMPSATPAAATAAASSTATDTATPVPVAAATASGTPTTAATAPATLSPRPTDTAAPTATPVEETASGASTWVYGAIVLAIGLIGAAAFFLRRQEK